MKRATKANEAIAAAVPTPVADLSISDVLKMPLFFENVKRQLTSLWNDREISLFFSQKFWIRSQPGIRRANGRLSVRLE